MAQDFVYVRRALQGPSVRSVYPAICGTMAANVSTTTNLSMQLPTVLPLSSASLSLSLLSPPDFSLPSVILEFWLEQGAAYTHMHMNGPSVLCWLIHKLNLHFTLAASPPTWRFQQVPPYGSNRGKAWQDPYCSVTLLFSHVAPPTKQQLSQYWLLDRLPVICVSSRHRCASPQQDNVIQH